MLKFTKPENNPLIIDPNSPRITEESVLDGFINAPKLHEGRAEVTLEEALEFAERERKSRQPAEGVTVRVVSTDDRSPIQREPTRMSFFTGNVI